MESHEPSYWMNWNGLVNLFQGTSPVLLKQTGVPVLSLLHGLVCDLDNVWSMRYWFKVPIEYGQKNIHTNLLYNIYMYIYMLFDGVNLRIVLQYIYKFFFEMGMNNTYFGPYKKCKSQSNSRNPESQFFFLSSKSI